MAETTYLFIVGKRVAIPFRPIPLLDYFAGMGVLLRLNHVDIKPNKEM